MNIKCVHVYTRFIISWSQNLKIENSQFLTNMKQQARLGRKQTHIYFSTFSSVFIYFVCSSFADSALLSLPCFFIALICVEQRKKNLFD